MARVESGEVRKTEGERIADRMPGSGRNQETMALFGSLGVIHRPPRPPRLGHLDSCDSLADSQQHSHLSVNVDVRVWVRFFACSCKLSY